MTRPKFITFTGIDQKTSVYDLVTLAGEYPVEFGILVGGDAAKNRYPSEYWIDRFLMNPMTASLKLSLHLCKEYAKSVNNHGLLPATPAWMARVHHFDRMQVNAIWYNTDNCLNVARNFKVEIIQQTRGEFEVMPEGLFQVDDGSGGRGIVPSSRAKPIGPGLVGYAGGFRPENVKAEVAKIEAENYWIDMETGVRNDGDWFDVTKARKVCQEVYDG